MSESPSAVTSGTIIERHRVYVANTPPGVTEGELSQTFSSCARVVGVWIAASSSSRNYAFVDLDSADAVQKVGTCKLCYYPPSNE